MGFDVVVIGGGPAGMAAALKARETGAKRVLIIERDNRLGGILNQCIHNGFGLHYFGKELTGPEYAAELASRVKSADITVMLRTFVTKVTGKSIQIINVKGVKTISARAIVLAMGCRERTAGAIAITGTRPAGVYTAGMVQKMVNHYGKLPGKSAVILGSGDIGLIMARRLMMEGVKVEGVIEIMPFSSGLARNMRQCIEDFNIPVYYNSTITRIIGNDRLEGVYYSKVDDKMEPSMSTEAFIRCDTLLLSVGLIPENDLVNNIIQLDPKTKGAIVDETRHTSADGIFASGNVLHIHDLADNATTEGEIAGAAAAAYIRGKLKKSLNVFNVVPDVTVGYVLPQKINSNAQNFKIYFRSKMRQKQKWIQAVSGGVVLAEKFMITVNPGEMQEIEIKDKNITGDIMIKIISKI